MTIVALSHAVTQHINFHYWENPQASSCPTGKVHSLLSKLIMHNHHTQLPSLRFMLF